MTKKELDNHKLAMHISECLSDIEIKEGFDEYLREVVGVTQEQYENIFESKSSFNMGGIRDLSLDEEGEIVGGSSCLLGGISPAVAIHFLNFAHHVKEIEDGKKTIPDAK